MGIVATDTKIKRLLVNNLLSTVRAFIHILQYILMAVGTLLQVKKSFQRLVDIFSVGMGLFVGNVGMAVLTGYLTMNRDVKTLGINQPGSLAGNSIQDK